MTGVMVATKFYGNRAVVDEPVRQLAGPSTHCLDNLLSDLFNYI